MATEKVSAVVTEKTDEDGNVVQPRLSVTVETDIGRNEPTQWFNDNWGENICTSKLYQKGKIDLQATLRSMLIAGKTEDECQEKASVFKPSITAPAKSTVEKALSALDKVDDPAQLEMFLAKLKEKAAKAKK